jgi:hypothetical protein
MNNNNISLEYANSLMYELEKAFYDERGKGARFRMTTVGREYFIKNCLPLLQSSDIDQILQTVKEFLQNAGIVSDVSYDSDDRLLKLQVKGCLHRPVEEKMIAREIEPFTCIPANLIVLAIEEKLDRPVELAEIKLEDGACQLLLVVFDHRPVLG